MGADSSLDSVRSKIDAIDDKLQRLLIERTELVETVRDLKKNDRIKIRPAREAEIVYRLIAQHEGSFPRRELVAIWRQIINATLSFEGSFSVAVYTPEIPVGYWDLARDHFGNYTPMTRHTSVRSVLEAVYRQDATVGVVPMVTTDDDDPWWRYIVTKDPKAPRVIARLPFAGRSNGIGGDLQALAVCPVADTPTGRDRSLLALDLEPGLGLNQVRRSLADVGLEPGFAAQWCEDQGTGAWLYLAEIPGYLASDDARLTAVEDHFGKMFKRTVVLGCYAEPLSDEELGTAVAPRKRSAGSARRQTKTSA